MTLNLNYEGFESNLLYQRDHDLGAGIQYIFRFENGYGASIVKHLYSYGHEGDLWELAVIEFYGEGTRDWELCYSTEITNDVIGCLSDEDVRELLGRIKGL